MEPQKKCEIKISEISCRRFYIVDRAQIKAKSQIKAQENDENDENDEKGKRDREKPRKS